MTVRLLLVLLLGAAVVSGQYYGTQTSARTYGRGSPWWRGLFHSGSSSFLPDEREIFPEWFEAEEADDCDQVPDVVNTGRPRDLCGDDDLDKRFCICLKRARRHTSYHVPGFGTPAISDGRYEPICGQCRDPCALRFVPDTFPRRDSSEESSEEDGDNLNIRRGRRD